MTTQKVLTAKKLLPCLLIENWAVIQRTDGTFGFHDHTHYLTIEQAKNQNQSEDFLKKFEFDEKPFIDAFEKFLKEKEVARIEKQIAAKEAEAKRIEELKKEIEDCQTPKELAEKFNLSVVELASHWSDLYEGRSTMGILISDAKENEILELTKEIHDVDGRFGEARRRDGEHHSTFSEVYDLASYQEGCKKHFNGDNYFYKSEESEADIYIDDFIKDIMENDSLTAFEKMEAIEETCKQWRGIEAGYYDCNGNLEIEEEKLESADFTGYYEDVYSYSFCFKFWQGNRWKEEEAEEENETAGN
jgi:hypothetical protein